MARLAAAKAVKPPPAPGNPQPIRPPRLQSQVAPHPIQAQVAHPLQAAQAPAPRLQNHNMPDQRTQYNQYGGAINFAGDTGGGGFDPTEGASSALGMDATSLGLDTPADPAIPSAGSDPTYIAQMNQLAQALANKKAEDQLLRSQYGQNYNDSLNMLGWTGDPASGHFDQNNQQGYYGQAYNGAWNDFASRGMLNSGSFSDALAQLSADYGQRKSGLDTGRTQYLSGLDQDLGSYTDQNTSAGADALMQAIARIAASRGVDPSQVPH